MRRLLVINQYFWPDVAATAQLLSDLAAEAVRQNWEVTALAGRGSYSGLEQKRLKRRESWNGVDIIRVRSSNLGRGSTLRRMIDYLTFLVSAGSGVVLGRRNDVVVCLSTPPMVAILGLIARFRGTRFIYKVEDLYPDVAVALGMLKERSLATRFFRGMSELILRRADVCVALDEAMGKKLRQRGANSVTVIPNWADGEAIRPEPTAGREFLARHGIAAELVVLYSGNMGKVHRFDEVIEAASVLAGDNPDVLFLFVGDGPRLEEVQSSAVELQNVLFLPYQPREALNELYNAADIHLVTLRDEVAGLLAPSKYPAALAAGKPILLVGGEGSEMHAEIARERLGATVSESAEIVAFLKAATQNSESLKQSGERSRTLFDEKYSLRNTLGQWLTVLDNLANPPAAS